MGAVPTSGQVLPFKAWSYGKLNTTTHQWGDLGLVPVALPVIAQKALFALPANELPNLLEPYGSLWKHNMGNVTMFVPGLTFTGFTCVYLKFYNNFVGQRIKIQIANNAGDAPLVMLDWTSVAYSNGSFLPVIQVCNIYNFKVNVSYWVEVLFATTINKAPGFYGSDGKMGFDSVYWWSINEQPVDPKYMTAAPTTIDPVTGAPAY